MSRDQSWTTPWGWDDSEGDDAPPPTRRPIDHTHTCPTCGRVSHCYGPGCGMPRAFVCGSCT